MHFHKKLAREGRADMRAGKYPLGDTPMVVDVRVVALDMDGHTTLLCLADTRAALALEPAPDRVGIAAKIDQAGLEPARQREPIRRQVHFATVIDGAAHHKGRPTEKG